MRWNLGPMSDNVEDRRDEGGGGRGPIGGVHLGIGGMLVLLILSVVFKRDFFALIGAGDGLPPGATAGSALTPAQQAHEDSLAHLVSAVLDSTQHEWAEVLPRMGTPYHDAKLVLFRDGIESACGLAQSASGPFYCPGDEKVYIDLGFYDELTNRFGAAGEFAEAYVIAHEIGHHVQKQLGIEARVRDAQQRHPEAVNELSVRLELQADCFAGVWGGDYGAKGGLDQDDFASGMRAAAAVGDDRIQRMTEGHVNPEAFTHGTSEQRQRWFNQGFQSRDPKRCDTFSAQQL
ncbi:MAG TPA: neutral zinc metallopeptidase [Gemmatimonadales bacterium]|nr:neutral zinc metallopeptidase [Gemmatimonadales bacterium]